MKHFLVIVFVIFSLLAFSQEKKDSSILEPKDYIKVLNQEVCSDYGINFPIFRVYSFQDKTGKHLLVLTERKYAGDNDNPKIDSIEAFCFLSKEEGVELEWKLKDFLIIGPNSGEMESSIWFWTKFLKIEDIDGDGFVEPIIVYGTNGINGTDDGRIKILVYYLGSKRGVRQQNGVLDYERKCKVDKAFYDLPFSIQETVMDIIQKLAENNLAIFPYGWQKAMKEKKEFFDEN